MDGQLLQDQPSHPLRAKMDSWLEAVPPDTLRWSINTRASSTTLKKAVQRSALQLKWYKIFCNALWSRGYNQQGRMIGSGQAGLMGTMELVVHKGEGFLSPETVLLDRCSKIIAALEKQQAIQSPPAKA